MEEDFRGVAGGGVRQAGARRKFVKHASAKIAKEFSAGYKEEVWGQESGPQIALPARPILTMAVTFHIPGALRDFTGGKAVVEISSSATVVSEALRALCTQYPGIRDRIATEQWEMRQHINVFVGDENIRFTGGLATRIKDGAKISIVPAISGGDH